MFPHCILILLTLRAYMKLYLTLCETLISLLRHRLIRFLLLSPDLWSRAYPYPTTGANPPKWRIHSLKDEEKGPYFHSIIREETSIIWVKKRSTPVLDCSYLRARRNYYCEGDVERRNQFLVYLKLNFRVKLSSSTAALVLSGVPERVANGFMSSKNNTRCHLCLYNSVWSTWCHLECTMKQLMRN